MKPGRNAPCPCGSGKKFKRCCGKNAQPTHGIDIQAVLQQALRELQNGRFSQAEALLQKVRQHAPKNAEAFNLLGIICAQTQRYDEAITHFKMALKLQPGVAETERNLGMVLCAVQQIDEGRKHFEQAIKIRPDYGQAYENLGNVLLQLDELEAAVKTLERAYALLPETAPLLNNLANAYVASGQAERAMDCYDRAVQKGGGVDVLMNKARLALDDNRTSLALSTLLKAREMASRDPSILFLMAEAQEGSGQVEEACDSLHQAQELGFPQSSIEVYLGSIYSRQGDFNKAIRHFETALEMDPNLTDAFVAIGQVTKSGQSSGLAEKIEDVLLNSELPDETRANLNFSLGRQYDSAHDFDRAFASYRRGNELRFKGEYSDYSVAQFRNQVSSLIDFFTPEFFDAFTTFGSRSERPIIIYGMPRSGTTLTEQILASHSDCFGAGELQYFPRLRRSMADLNCKDDWPGCLGGIDSAWFDETAREYLDYLSSLDGNAAKVSNKMPHNFMDIGLIYLLFPNARFVHCMRLPIDNCLSIYFQNFSGNHPYAYDLQVLGEYYLEYRRLVDHWKAVLPAAILEMPYEETVESFEERARELVDYCGLPWEEACLEPHRAKRAVKTSSVWQARQQVYTSSVERWRNYESHLQPLIDALGPSAPS